MQQKLVHNFTFRLATLLIVTTLGFSQWTSDTGVVYEVETTHHTGTRNTETMQMSVLVPNLLKLSMPQESASSNGAPGDVVFRGDRSEVIVVDHGERSYMVFDKKMIDEMGEQLKEVKKMAGNMTIPQAALDRMPEEQRKKLEAMMGQGKPGAGGAPAVPEFEYKNTGERATKNGYPCVKYEVTRDDKKVRELWITDWDNVEGGQDVQGVFSEMARFFEEMMAAVGDMLGGEGAGLFGGRKNPMDAWAELDGFPVVTREFDDGELESESVLRSAKRQTLDPAEFEPPSGYKRRTMGR